MPLDDKYRALARTGRARIWNETVELLFLTDRGVSDPSRENRQVQATVRAGNEDAANASGGGAEAWQSQIAAGKVEARIERASYDGPMPRRGDKIRRLERAGQPFYEITYVNDRDAGDLILHLSEA